MTEILLGKARHEKIGNDLFWSFLKHDDGMPDHFINLRWSGYNDYDWWTKWSKGTETKEQGGRKFRIYYASYYVYELIGD